MSAATFSRRACAAFLLRANGSASGEARYSLLRLSPVTGSRSQDVRNVLFGFGG